MIKQISWSSYWSILAATTIFYYVLICLRFYSNEIKQVLTGKSRLLFKRRVIIERDQYNAAVNESQELFPLINQLVQEIKIFLQGSLRKNLQRQEIVYGFQLLLKKYPTVKGTPFEPIVNNYIINECSNYCSIHLEEEEVTTLWLS